MNEPAHAYAPAPDAPPAPPAPQMPAGFELPTDPAAALDVTAPLVPLQLAPLQQPEAPAQPAAPQQLAATMQPAAPAQPAAPQVMPAAMSFSAPAAAPAEHAAPATHGDHPTSLAMPAQETQPAQFQAMPDGYAGPAVTEIGGVPAASPDDLAELRAADDATGAASPGAIPQWASPGLALVIAMFALTWQLVAFYAREVLPDRVVAGMPLDNFDAIVGGLPLLDGTPGSLVGMLLGFGTLILVMLSVRAGVREPVLQGAVGLIGLVALLATVLLPRLAG